MSHFLTQEQEALLDTTRAFVRRDLEPIANRIDHDEEMPRAILKTIAELGFFALFIPETYGGLGASLTTSCLVLEEIAKSSPSLAALLSVEMILCPATVTTLGTETQKQRLLPASASGERPMTYSQTEPAGAANVMAHQTRLTPDGVNYRLNGAKLFSTQGQATTYLVMCRTSQAAAQGYGCVIVEREDAGFQAAPYEDKLGWRGTNTGAVSFNNILIRQDRILGNLLTANADHPLAQKAGYLGHSAAALGCAEGMFAKTMQQVKDRTLYGGPMHKLSPISHRLAEVYVKIEAMRALLYTSTRLHDEGRHEGLMGSVCKAFICNTAFDCTHALLQLWGGSGIMNSTGINRYFRDARTNMIAEGATEMHEAGIALVQLGLGL